MNSSVLHWNSDRTLLNSLEGRVITTEYRTRVKYIHM